ncbi:lactoylglutathione lyase, partial [Bacillus toyonensis]
MYSYIIANYDSYRKLKEAGGVRMESVTTCI